MIISYINEEDNKTELNKIIRDNSIDGIIVLATEMCKEDLKVFRKASAPIVILDSFFGEARYDTVAINNVQGSYKATKYLIDNGHTEIGYLSSSIWINNFEERMDGFLKALKDNNIKMNPEFIFYLEPTLEGAYQDMLKHLNTKSVLPIAFFSANDIIGFGAIKAIKEKGIKIPEDISIVGFDDMPFCDMVEPALTTIKVYKQSMG